MLTRLVLKNLTVFTHADFEFSPWLNVVVGENGTGKTQVLKAAYTVASVMGRGAKESELPAPTRTYLETALASKLRGVFRPERLGRLARRHQGVNRCEIAAEFRHPVNKLSFSFHTNSTTEVTVKSAPSKWVGLPPVYLPTRELLTIYPGFVALYDEKVLPFEETWRDTCLLLGGLLPRRRPEGEVADLLVPLEEALGGKVVLEGEKFYVESSSGKLEVHLVAEGLRKVAMLAQLVVTGALTKGSTLFWDEPEANLNPKIIKRIARTILQLSRKGIQVFVATHSLFLLRELDIALRTEEFRGLECRFFGLQPGDDGVRVEQGDSIDDIGKIDALDEELSQSDRYMDAEAAS
ncbi:MAG: AAA family ATPase [Isosphaeraceae bacterium]